jgi:hypothetical protein
MVPDTRWPSRVEPYLSTELAMAAAAKPLALAAN